MRIPLWRRIIDVVAFVVCALAAAGFTASAIGEDRPTSDRLIMAGIVVVLIVMLWRAAPVVLRRQR